MISTSELTSPETMKELIQYFEAHGQELDQQELKEEASAPMSEYHNSFISCIRFRGIPILPPVLNSKRLEEVRQDRHNAVIREKHLKARQRRHLMEVAASLVENTEAHIHPSDPKSWKYAASRLPQERPSVLKPVVASAWTHVAVSGTTSSIQSLDSLSATGTSNVANTFATAEQLQGDFGMQTLDTVGSEFTSLEETLPTDFNGVPLTSFKQQKISQDLLRLSKLLKVKDFNSTGGSDVSELPQSECTGDDIDVNKEENDRPSAQGNLSGNFFRESQDTVVEVTPDNIIENTTSGFVDNSMDVSHVDISSQGDGNFSCGGSANTSGTSSANTTGTTDSHRSRGSSPRSFRSNTVHFASFVTEYIDTRANISSENIKVVKKKLPGELAAKNNAGGKSDSELTAIRSQANKTENMENGGLLSNVSLAESDSPAMPASVSNPSNLPFQLYAKGEPSSSDKENDAMQANKLSNVVTDVMNISSLGLSQNPVNPGSNTSVTDSQGSSSNSTLIEDTVALTNHASANNLPLKIVKHQKETKTGKESENILGSVPKHKSKKLPQEPSHTNGGQQHVSKQTEMAGPVKKGGVATGYPHKGHVRRGSYTLSEPSPALVRAQGKLGVQRKLAYREDENLTQSVSIKSNPTVPLEPESAGKAEHIKKYLSQVQLHSMQDMTVHQVPFDLSQCHSAASTQLQDSFSILQSLTHCQNSFSGEISHEFESLRHNLLEEQQKELEELFIQQRREQMSLQMEIEEHQRRMKEQQDFLVSNAPENLKVQSRTHGEELSPDSDKGDKISSQRINFPIPVEAQINLHGKKSARAVTSPGSLLLNTSASSASSRVRRPVLRSPVKLHSGHRNIGQVVVPPEAYKPEMLYKFEKLTAAAKGFLCRRLLYSDKVQELVKTIKDTRDFAFSFQSETPIRKGNYSNQDRTLLERIVAQLQAALLDIHEIFFDIPVSEQMALIEQTRVNNREKRLKSPPEENLRGSTPRISMATLKAQERRRKAQEAESAVFGSNSDRPRTAPATSSSARSHSSVDLRALKPSSKQATHNHSKPLSARLNSTRSDKSHLHSAPAEKTALVRHIKPAGSSVVTSNRHVMDTAEAKPKFCSKQPPQQSASHAGSGSSAHSGNNKSSKAAEWSKSRR